MTGLSDYVESNLVDWLVGGTDMPTAHANVHVALHTGDPSETGSDNEVSGNNYSRVQTTANGDWARSANTFENANLIDFPDPSGSWGDVSHFSLWDGSSGSDNMLVGDVLDETVTITDGFDVFFAAGDLSGDLD